MAKGILRKRRGRVRDEIRHSKEESGKEGLTLAAILLFGKDNTILNALPHYRTDAILRRDNLDRYDDRDDIRTNLIDSYDRLMAFVSKHLPDPFFLEGDIRISLRNKIFREAVANILMHREYSHAFPAKMIIEHSRVLFENANRPHGHGLINPKAFTPFPKNPVIAKVFKEIGLADELGSGVRNLFKYTRIFSKGRSPQLIEDDIFKIIIPIPVTLTARVKATLPVIKATGQATVQATEQAILEFCIEPKSTKEIMDHMGLKHREHFRSMILNPFLNRKLLLTTIPEKPTSPKQKYYSNNEKISTYRVKGNLQSTQAKGKDSKQATGQVTEQAAEQAILAFCIEPKSTKEIMEHMGLKHREHFRSNILKPLIEKKLLFMTIPKKPKSPKQRYISYERQNDD